MKGLSFRAKVTLWNVTILVGAVVAASLALNFAAQYTLIREIDSDLEAAASRAPSPPPRPRDQPPGNPFGEDQPGPDFEPMRDGPRPPPPPRHITGAFDLTVRHFDPLGHILGPNGAHLPDLAGGSAIDPSAMQHGTEGWSGITQVEHDGTAYRVFTRPLQPKLRPTEVIQVSRPISDVEELSAVMGQALLVFVPVAVLAGIGAGALLTSIALRPLGQLAATAKGINAQNWEGRLEVAGSDELASLGNNFNEMLDRLRSAFGNIEAALEQQKRFTADASHELRTPLSRVILVASNALDPQASEEERMQALSVVASSSKDMSALVDQMLTLARADAGRVIGERVRCDLRVLIAETADEFASHRQIDICVPDRPLPAKVDLDGIRRVLRNLISNAVKYSAGPIRIAGTLTGNTGVVVEVEDRGPGIPSESLPHLGERFFRLDSARASDTGGAGLGLSIVKAIVEAHGGRLHFESRVGVGTKAVFSIGEA